MNAIDKLRAALAEHVGRNVDPHEEFVWVGDHEADLLERLDAPPEREAWQDDDAGEAEPLTLFDMFCVLDEIAELQKRPPVEKADEIPATDPGARFMQILAQWQDERLKLAFFGKRELELRTLLFNATFPSPGEGTQKHTLPDGRTIKGQYKINRTIDEAALPAVLTHMRELGVANADALVKYKPTLVKREWNSLGHDARLAFSPAVIASPGTPTLDVELPKGSRG